MSEATNSAVLMQQPSGPVTTGFVLDRTFRLLRGNLRLFLGIAGVPIGAWLLILAVIGGAIFLIVGPHPQNLQNPWTILPVVAPLYLVFLILGIYSYALFAAATSYAASEAWAGRTATVGQAYDAAWKRSGSYAWLYFVRTLYAAWPLLLSTILVGGGILIQGKSDDANPAGIALMVAGVLGYFAGFVYAIFCALRWALAFPASVNEGLSADAALKRSSELTNGIKGTIFLSAVVIYLVAYVLEMILGVVLAILFGIGALVIGALQIADDSPAGYAVIGVGGLIAVAGLLLWMAMMWASYSISFTVIYQGQKTHKERLASPPPAELPIAPVTPPPGEPA